jgi:hypothetical protein
MTTEDKDLDEMLTMLRIYATAADEQLPKIIKFIERLPHAATVQGGTLAREPTRLAEVWA